jgi:tRNA(Ile)-lysidine synthase
VVGPGRGTGGLIPPDRLRAAAGGLLERLGPLLSDVPRPVAVACSGGTDSLALLVLSAAAGLDPVAVHVDHGARPESAAEADLVRHRATAVGAGFLGLRVQVDPGPGFEARAREARYQALERAQGQLGAGCVLVGHTRDDQAETVLLNLLRGGAVAGLAGMPARRGSVVRPLLGVARAELSELCARLGLDPLEDPMNADCAHRRVWLRREVIPLLEAGTGRDLRPLLARQAGVARAESELLDGLAAQALAEAGEPPSAAALAALPTALARRVVRAWLPVPAASLEHVEAVLEVAGGKRRSADIPGGIRVVRSAGHLHQVDGAEAGTPAPEPVPLELPGRAAGLGVQLEAWVERAAPVRWPDGRWSCVLDADVAGDRAWLRPPAQGERFRPLGLGGEKAVADALAEIGVPPEERRRHPVLARTSGEPLWVLGYRIDDRARVSAGTRRFLWVTAESGGGA